MLAPMPLKRSSGGRALSPRRIPTRSTCPPTSSRLISTYFSITYRPGAASSSGYSSPPSPARGGGDLARARLDPVQPVRPPASAVLCRPLQPRLRPGLARRAAPKERLGIAGRIEQTLDMAAIGEHEGAALSVELRRAVAALPWRDVIGHAGNDISVQLDTAHIERDAAHLQARH